MDKKNAKNFPTPEPMFPTWNDAAERIDLPTSRAWGEDTQAMPKECWKNSALAGAAHAGAVDHLMYHEGWALIPLGGSGTLLPIEHGWLETPAGAVIDVTLPLVARGDAELLATVYVSALAWRVEDVRALVDAAGKVTLPLSGRGGAALSDAARVRLRETMMHVFGLPR